MAGRGPCGTQNTPCRELGEYEVLFSKRVLERFGRVTGRKGERGQRETERQREKKGGGERQWNLGEDVVEVC